MKPPLDDVVGTPHDDDDDDDERMILAFTIPEQQPSNNRSILPSAIERL
eukprot:CAMPEP_0194237056 /NCGR_PEP_ID=MMETSP0158-20130606/4172_1 /TAXON_ID=33649 /ORGANISM="Thalassionema nitzschioides, Strain L26-B" /LENGTH=48 /DNA_ID= /DNA_START= /DNA_END= /DNA_ORIENTATION=